MSKNLIVILCLIVCDVCGSVAMPIAFLINGMIWGTINMQDCSDTLGEMGKIDT